MTRSRKRKLQRLQGLQARKAWVPLATALFAAGTSLHAQQAQPTAVAAAGGGGEALEEIVVTAQKHAEALQQVPISIQVLGTEKLADMQVSTFDDYAKLLPSVSFESFGPGQATPYFRGIASTTGGQLHAGPRSPTGMYLDEIPITNIAGNPDLHMYDIQRVEALAGPQGTLYGAGSLAGTLRVITNKPTSAKFEAGYDVQASGMAKGNPNGEFEGFVNVPLSENAAIRLVGYVDHEGGYIDNVLASRTYLRPPTGATAPCNPGGPAVATCPLTVTNAGFAKDRFNPVDTAGGRAAMQIDLNDQWVISPMLVYQQQRTSGAFNFDPLIGDLKVTDFTPDHTSDNWYQAALTVEGKIANFDLTYSGGYFKRHSVIATDYSEYSIAYDYYGYSRFRNNQGNLIDPTQSQTAEDRYTKLTHELRVSSHVGDMFNYFAGLFYQRGTDNIRDSFLLQGLGDTAPYNFAVPGQANTLYLSQQDRVDRDYAIFFDGTLKVTDQFKVSAGIRGFRAHNTLTGFFGYNNLYLDPNPNIPALANTGDNFAHGSGTSLCNPQTTYVGLNLPCVNTDKSTTENGETHRVNLTYQLTPDQMVYTTYSTGFRPGGPNRRAGLQPYGSDKLTNFEAGWKTSWLNHRLRFNGAAFYEKWKDVQLEVGGLNGITDIFNIGNARVRGVEADVSWLPFEHLELSASGSYVNAITTSDFCGEDKSSSSSPTYGQLLTNCPGNPSSPAGTQLPVAPPFKGNMTARYKFNIDNLNMYTQASVFHQGSATSILDTAAEAQLGATQPFTTMDFSFGGGREKWKAEFFVKNVFDTRGQLNRGYQCTNSYCFANPRIYPTQPQTFGIKFSNSF